MNKQDIIDFVAECAGITKVQARRSIDCYHKAVQGAMRKGDSVTLVGFGTFKVAKRQARKVAQIESRIFMGGQFYSESNAPL